MGQSIVMQCAFLYKNLTIKNGYTKNADIVERGIDIVVFPILGCKWTLTI